jgi:hypothetical protein
MSNLPGGVQDSDIPGNRPFDRDEKDMPVFYSQPNVGRRLTKEELEDGVDRS